MLSSLILSAPPAQADCVVLTKKCRIGQNGSSIKFLVDQAKVYWILQGSTVREINLVLGRWPVIEEGTKPPEPGFCVRSDTDYDSRENEELGSGMNHKQARAA